MTNTIKQVNDKHYKRYGYDKRFKNHGYDKSLKLGLWQILYRQGLTKQERKKKHGQMRGYAKHHETRAMKTQEILLNKELPQKK